MNNELTYAAEIVDGTVTRVIVGTAEWATEHLGGEWVQPSELVGIGWAVVDGQIIPPEPEPESDDPLQYNVI